MSPVSHPLDGPRCAEHLPLIQRSWTRIHLTVTYVSLVSSHALQVTRLVEAETSVYGCLKLIRDGA